MAELDLRIGVDQKHYRDGSLRGRWTESVSRVNLPLVMFQYPNPLRHGFVIISGRVSR